MSYRSGILLAIILHIILLLGLTQIDWPSHQKTGWQNTVIVQSYVYAKSSSNAVQTQNTHQQLASAKDSILSHSTHAAPIPPRSTNAAKKLQANLSEGQYNQLLILLHNAIAEQQTYPANAEMLGQRGKVTVGFELATSGAISDIKIIHSSGFPLLDQAALAAVAAINPFTAMTVSKNTTLVINIDYS